MKKCTECGGDRKDKSRSYCGNKCRLSAQRKIRFSAVNAKKKELELKQQRKEYYSKNY